MNKRRDRSNSSELVRYLVQAEHPSEYDYGRLSEMLSEQLRTMEDSGVHIIDIDTDESGVVIRHCIHDGLLSQPMKTKTGSSNETMIENSDDNVDQKKNEKKRGGSQQQFDIQNLCNVPASHILVELLMADEVIIANGNTV